MSDIINVVYNTLRGVPVDLRELVITERDNGDALRRRIDDGSMSSNDMLTFYHEEYERTYRLSDEGRRFNDAFQVMYAPQSREELNEALQDISNSEWLHGEADDLMSVVNREFEDIYDGIDDVRHQIRVTDESVKLLVRQQTDMQFRTMSRQLAKLFTQLGESVHAKGRYDIGTATTSLLTLPTRARETPVKTAAPELQMQADDGIAQVDLNGIVAAGGPRIHHMIELVAAHPVLIDDAGDALADSVVDIAASFNELPADERRESEIVGFLSYLGSASPAGAAGNSDCGQIPVPRESLWHCVTTDGRTRVWRTCALFVPGQVLKDFLDDTMVED